MLTTFGLVLLDVRQGLLTPDGLSRRAGVALADPRVSAFLADRATNAVLAAQPDLTAFRPVIASVASTAVSSQAFQRAMQMSIRSAAAAASTEATRNIALSIPDLGVLFRSVLTQGNPRLAEKIPPRVRGVVAEFDQGKAAGDRDQPAPAVERGWPASSTLLIGLGLACIAGAFA